MNRSFRLHLLLLQLVLGSFFALPARAQLGFNLDIKKPEPYDNRQVKAEKTPDKPIKAPKRLMQNMVTHYNYFFNANAKLNEVIEVAKSQHKDNYTRLLPFYNYTLDATAAQAQLLDSVVIKSKTGIVLHDLRNDWVDNLYLLWGAAHYLKKEYDSAYTMFQFINWAFAEKEKDGYYRYIGSRMDGNNAMQVATKEKPSSLPRRMFSEPPSRNEALVWMIRTYIQQGALIEAGSLISTLRNDPVFPKRLRDELEEIQALYFYNQKVWDSAALHLVQALGAAGNRQERARWEYLAAQLFERTNNYEQARLWYGKAIDHTVDPVMEVYARLNLIRINKEGGDGYIDRNVATLVKMARKDKYEDYRDVIYSMLAQMELERGNFAAAQDFLRKSGKYKTDNQTANNEAYLALADRTFEQKQYQPAATFYDSVRLDGLLSTDSLRVQEWKPLLTRLIYYTGTIERQDSLQRIAFLSEDERRDFIRKMVRQLRRAQGLKEEAQNQASRSTPAPDPFTQQNQNPRGEWYFYSDNARRTGQAAFKATWGDRPNVDNWRRMTDVSNQLRSSIPEATRGLRSGSAADPSAATDDPLSYEALVRKVPLTPEAMKLSNDSIQYAMRGLARLYAADMEDHKAAVETLEALRRRFPEPDSMEQVLFGLYFSYRLLGNTTKAEEIKRLLEKQFPSGRYTAIASTGQDPQSGEKKRKAATKAYEAVYDLYLSGRYQEAEAAKRNADSTYGTSVWEPQLLYIQAVAQIKQQQDSAARQSLNTLIAQHAGTVLAQKAQTMINVLGRRRQIEEELRNLQIERPKEDTFYVEPMPVATNIRQQSAISAPGTKDSATVVINRPLAGKPSIDSSRLTPVRPIAKPVSDSSRSKPPKPVIRPGSPYNYHPDSAHFAVVALINVDQVFTNEARNAFNRYNAERGNDRSLQVAEVNDQLRLLLIGPFNNASDAVEYVRAAKPVAGSEILPWMRAANYSFSIISQGNLNTVRQAKSMDAYRAFLEQVLPVKL